MRNTKTVKLSIKSVDEDGQFEGYGSVFGVKDFYDEIVAPGAFTKSLADHKAKSTMPALLWQHDARIVCGVYQDMREDAKGLYVKGQLALDIEKGKEAHSLLKMKALNGLSIGFRTVTHQYDHDAQELTLLEVDLWEVSLVTFPANPEARVDAVKNCLDGGKMPTVRDFERMLRDDAGFSQSQARTIIDHGFKALRSGDPGDQSAELEDLVKHAGRVAEILKVA